MNVTILQPSYIPWRGYFHQILKSDLFIFYDDVQYDKRGWRNRNQVKTPHGKKWLTIPVKSHGAQTDNIPINEIKIAWDEPWNESHLKTLHFAYNQAPFYSDYLSLIKPIFERHDDFLADLTILLTTEISYCLGNKRTKFLRSSSLPSSGVKSDRLLSLLNQVGASNYISGPSAKDYLELEKFEAAGISVEFMTYDYPEYPQLYPPFDGNVSILDLLFMVGPKTKEYILPG